MQWWHYSSTRPQTQLGGLHQEFGGGSVIFSHNKYAYIHIYMFMQDTYWRNKLIRRSNKRRKKTSLEKYIPLTLLQGFERVVQGLHVRGSWRSNITKYFDPQSQRCVFLVLLMLNRRPWGPLWWVLAFFTASYQHLFWTPIHQGFPRAPSTGCGFPYYISSPTPSDLQLNCPQLPSWLHYIIIQRLHDCPLDLWNWMFNRHQAEITVMQFIGHSLPVHQSMSVPWEFFSSSHFISQFPPMRFPLITAIRMCHLLPVHHLGMAFLAGQKVKIQQ